MVRELNILGVRFTVEEVECVSKEELRKGEINYLDCAIRIDRNLPKESREQVLMHEILHAICELMGYEKLGMNEKKMQGLATALHQVFTAQTIFS